MPRAIVIRTAGTNCDGELMRAFSLAGAEPELVHLDRLIREPGSLERFDLIGFPGGFSYGDDIASGRIFAMRIRERLYPALRGAVERGVPVIGVCNGFQVLVQVGLLPGPRAGEPWPTDRPPAQTVALAENVGARFVDRWVPVRFEPGSRCIWTRGLAGARHDADADIMQLPVAHGEGRFIAESPELLAELERSGQVALRYLDNYNGSQGAIAGVSDASGLVFGLMPHPERYLEWDRHPYWTRLSADVTGGPTPGLRLFQNAVEAVARMPV
ncbi:MAG: phosphoribosylformylglycinamidine synthase subunit PurQ [Phycisphaerales bacterium]